eukprot:jgi/Botrbrau1/7572/Bobra.0159s0021.2
MTDGFPSNGASFAQTQAELLQDRDNLPFVINPGTATLCVGRAGSAEPTCSAHCIAFPTINGAVPPGHRGGRRGDFSVESRRESAAVQVAELLGVSLPQRTVYPPASLAGPLLTYGSSFSWSDSPSGNADGEPLIGDEALRLWNEEAYCLFWPMREGRLNVGAGTSLQQVKDALEKIWGNALEGLMEDLNLEPSSSWSELSVVLLVPLTLSPREIKEMVDVLLINLGFGSLVLHVEAVAAAFGGGLSAACVVHLGRHSSSVCCVEDASLLPSTWRLLLYGVDDVADVLLWLLKRIGEWPPAANFDPWRSARDQNSLVHMVNHAFVPLEGELCRIQHLIRQRPAVPMCLHHSVTGGTRLQLPLSVAACMAPYAYLYPALLDPPRPAPEEQVRFLARHHSSRYTFIIFLPQVEFRLRRHSQLGMNSLLEGIDEPGGPRGSHGGGLDGGAAALAQVCSSPHGGPGSCRGPISRDRSPRGLCAGARVPGTGRRGKHLLPAQL